MKSKLKAPGSQRLKLKYDETLSIVAFESNLRHYTTQSLNAAIAICGPGTPSHVLLATSQDGV